MPPVYLLPRSRACDNCAAAKARCEPAAGSTKCKRCTKQGAACIVQAVGNRKKRKRIETCAEDSNISLPAKVANGSVNVSSCTIFEVERGMSYYRTALFEYFPFVIMPDVKHSAAEFRKSKPFLALVIAMLGCTADRARQRELLAHTKQFVALQIVQRGEKSLDLLQGLLVLIHWSHLQLEMRKQRSIFMHMSMSLIVDLGMNRSPFARRHFVTATEGTEAFTIRTEFHAEKLEDHTAEEKRAFLGCIYLSSVLSNTSVNLSVVQFNDYAEECCDALYNSGIETDKTLASLCRLQHSVQQFRVVSSWFNMTQRACGTGYEFIYSFFRQTSSPGEVLQHVRDWDAKISAQWNATPESVKTKLLTIQYGYARVCLYQCCLEESLFSSSSARLEVLNNCISAIRFLNDALVPIALEPLALLDVPCHIFSQSNHNTFLALLLCSVNCGNISTKLIDHELRLREYFAKTVDRLAVLHQQVPDEALPSFYKKLVPMSRGVQEWFTRKLRVGEEGETNVTEKHSDAERDIELNFDLFLNMDNDQWLQEVLALDVDSFGANNLI